MAQQLRELGFNAVALDGGFDGWREKMPVEPHAMSEVVSRKAA